jgi:hypothetical protein
MLFQPRGLINGEPDYFSIFVCIHCGYEMTLLKCLISLAVALLIGFDLVMN